MSTLSSQVQREAPSRRDENDRRSNLIEQGRRFAGPSTGLLVAGLVVTGLGFLAWRYLGPDLVRYIKIERM